MALLKKLKEQLLAKTEDELVDLLCKPDEKLRFSHLMDLSMTPESTPLDTEFTGRTDLQAKLVRRVIAPLLLEKMGPAQFLDNPRVIRGVDNQGMLGRVHYLYGQMAEMHERMKGHVASSGPLPPAKRILAFGLGGSAIGALLAREIIQNQGYSAPLDIHTSYPANFHGIDSDTLVVVCSYSGDTEETLYAFDHAVRHTDKFLILSRGGELGKLSNKYPLVKIPKSDIMQPRESIGFWVSAFLFLVSSLRLGKRSDGNSYKFDMTDLERVKARLDETDGQCGAETPFAKNPAKQYATYFLYGTMAGGPSAQVDWQHPCTPVLFLDDADRAIGKRLANQFGETIEHPIWLMVLCEDAHNEIESVATVLLEENLSGTTSRSYVFVSSRPYDSPSGAHAGSRASQRMEATLETLFQEHGVEFLRIATEGNSVLERKLSLLKLLDYTRAYISLLRGTPPIPVIFMDLIKGKMKKIAGVADRDLLRTLVGGGKLPISQEGAPTLDKVKELFPALRHTILERLLEQDYLAMESQKLNLTEKGARFIE